VEVIGWARADWNGFVCSGTIGVDDNGFRDAAVRLNSALGPSCVDRGPRLGLDGIEGIYQDAEVRPTWRRLESETGSLLDAFSVPMGDDFGFAPYIRNGFGPDLEEKALADVQVLSFLRVACEWCRKVVVLD
jgi:hypothetical protein